ncbi:MAG TPA: M56 family metallopeptidase, partial [Christiangramia sp.]|nr:M56 family metallopeptidase [Christiangramia sp.]
LQYIIEVIFFQLAFLLIYEIWLQKETFFNLNRAYLLTTPILSLFIPFIKIGILRETAPAVAIQNFTNSSIITLPEVFIGQRQLATETTSAASSPESFNWLVITYLIGILIATCVFVFKLWKLESIKKGSRPTSKYYSKIYEIPNSDAAFTYFNNLFVGDKITEKDREHIITHELVHLHQKHGIDLVIFEIMKIVFWFNPLIYIFQTRLATLHEFIADETTVQKSGKKIYFEQLLNSAFGTSNISFTNQFFNHSLIKKRIIMLQKNKSSNISKFKFLLVIPLMLAMLTYVSCSEELKEDEIGSSISQYNYTLEKAEGMTSEKQKIHDKFEEFLFNNPDYVALATIDYDAEEIRYSIHPRSEKVPEGYNKMEVASRDGREYTMYMNLKAHHENQDAMESENIDNSSYDGKSEVPFAIIDKVPAFQGCNELSGKARKDCTSEEISFFVNKNFDTSLGKKLGLSGINRVIVQFRIDETGNIQDIKARAPHADLEKEAKRVIASIPTMIPGEQNGKPVSVMYSLPIAFKVSE